MTLHTKAATEDILDIFNQPLRNVDPLAQPPDSDGETNYDDDDYTSAGESTGTGRISGTSEFEDTQPDIKTEPLSIETPAASVSPWSDFTASKHIPKLQHDKDDEDSTTRTEDASAKLSVPDDSQIQETHDSSDAGAVTVYEDTCQTHDTEENENLVTPVGANDDVGNDPPATKYVPIPPEDYEPPVRASRDPATAVQNRLPFMTPIVERTESSLGAFTLKSERDYSSSKTPSRNNCNPLISPEIGEEALSSPFRELINEARPERLPKLEIPIRNSKSEPAESNKRELINDARCNPVDESIRTIILENLQCPLPCFPGYHDHRPASCNKAPEIRKYIKSLAKPRSDGKTTASLCVPPTIRFQTDSVVKYTIKKELGKGAFAPVYLAKEEHCEESADQGEPEGQDVRLLAMKCEHPPSPWEFYIMSTLRDRLTSQANGPSHTTILPSLCKPEALHMFADEAYLLESYLDQGTLLDLVNLAKSDPTGQSAILDESIAMYFTIELLRVVEATHSVGILHGDLKADNCLIRLAHSKSSAFSVSDDVATSTDELSSYYSADGSHGWSQRGLCLIDFGRGIDLRAFRSDVEFIADWKTGKQDCIEMREMRPWTYQIDYWGMAGVAHSLLFGKYLDDNVIAGSSSNNNNDVDATADQENSNNNNNRLTGPGAKRTRYRLSQPLKRYWQTALWTRLFDILLNPVLCAGAPAHEGGEPDGRMPCTQSLARVRRDMEAWLEGEGGKRNGGLKSALRRLEERIGKDGKSR